MSEEPFEVWEHRINVLFDKKLKLIKGELKQLKQAHDAVANQHSQILLETQQLVAALKIDNLVNTGCSIIEDMDYSQKSNLHTQMIADAASAKSKIINSPNPYGITNAFKDKWIQILQGLGGGGITF